MAEETVRAITWEAPEHHHTEKGSDWYWALGIVAVAATVTAVVLGNMLFGVIILLIAAVTLVVASRTPDIIPYAVTARGVRINNELFPYSTLECFCIDEDNPLGPQLLVRSERLFMPLIVVPIPEEYIDEIDDLISTKLPEEHLEEPFGHKLLEFFGF